MFEEDYYKNYYKVEVLNNKLDKRWWSNYYYSTLIRKYCRNKKGNLLEIGCGLGGLLSGLENDFNTYGIEVSEYAFNIAKKLCRRTNLLLFDVQEGLRDRFQDISFDVILARHVLEHLKNPEKTIAECASYLTKGGIFMFSTPNTLSLFKNLKGENWIGFRDKSHISIREPREWIQYTKEAKLKILKVFSDGLWDVPYIKFIPKVFQYVLMLPTALEIITATPFLPAYGESIIIIAQK